MSTGQIGKRRARVFLGEDNEADIYLVRQALRQNAIDCDLEVARNGEDALLKLTNGAVRPPDLVLLDVNLPRIDGLSVLRAMRQRAELSDTAVVIMTSSDAPRDREEAASLGVKRFIHKASRLDEFLAIGVLVKELLANPGGVSNGKPPALEERGGGTPKPATTRLSAVTHPVEARTEPPSPPRTPPPADPSIAASAAPPPSTRLSLPRDARARVPTGSSLRPARPLRRGSTISRRSITLWAIPAGAAALIATAGFFGHDAIEGTMVANLKRDLESRVAATSQAVRIWFELKTTTARFLASEPRVQESAAALALPASGSGDSVRASGPAVALREAVAPTMSQSGFEAFALLAPDGRVLLDSAPPPGESGIAAEDFEVLSQVLGGTPRLFRLQTMPPSGDLQPRSLPPRIFLAMPVQSVQGRPIAVLALQLPLANEFKRVVVSARVGESGEAMVFDVQGRMLSESRFEDQLRAAGLLGADEDSSLRFETRDPGGNVTKGFRPAVPLSSRPLTRSVASAILGEKGVDVAGFRDYRGVEVVGAWDWLPDLGLGVVFKMDSTEAFVALRHLRIAFWSVLAAVLAAGVGLTAGAALIRRLGVNARVRQVGQYTLVEKIGEGAMGTVYRASHAMLSRPAAVKLLDAWEPKAVQRFEREVQLTSRLSHPSTVAIYDYGRTEEGVFYYAMEHLEGIDLADLIHLAGPLPPARVIHILRQVCGSLAEAHAQGLVHRDIKPSNIMLTVRGGEADVVKVVDFGLARLMDADPSLKLTKDGALFGTPGFIPPEALTDPDVFDARGDLYALGAVAFELLSGLPPFDRTSAEHLWHCHIEIVPPPPSVRLGSPLPRDLEAVVMKLLAKDPARRPQSAIELRDLLDACTQCGTWTQSEATAWWKTIGPKPRHTPHEVHLGEEPGSTIPFRDGGAAATGT